MGLGGVGLRLGGLGLLFGVRGVIRIRVTVTVSVSVSVRFSVWRAVYQISVRVHMLGR